MADAGAILDLDVRLSIDHTYDADLDVYLVSPAGTRIELFTDVGGSGDDFTDTILDDEATASITTGSAPFTGRFRPEGDLTLLEGQNLSGTWTLEVTDDARKNTGTLRSWSITVRYSPTPQLAASSAATPAGHPALTVAQAAPILAAASGLWSARGVDTAVLHGLEVRVVDLPGDQLATAFGRTLSLDVDAAGVGWFLDATPTRNEEFLLRRSSLRARAGTPADGRYDLLSVVLHEYGHWLGHGHDDHGLMAEALAPGARELPPRHADHGPTVPVVPPTPRRPTPIWFWSDSDLTALVTESILSQPKRRLRPSEFRSNL